MSGSRLAGGRNGHRIHDRLGASDDLLAQRVNGLDLGRINAQRVELTRQPLPRAEGVAQLAGAALDGGGGVVQFVRQPGGQRAEGRHLFTLAEHGLGAAQARVDRVQERQRSGRAGGQYLPECLFADLQKGNVLHDAPGGRARRLVEQRHLADHLARPAHRQRHLLLARPLANLDPALQHHVQCIAHLAFAHQPLAGRERHWFRPLVQRAQVSLGQVGEEGQTLEELDAHRRQDLPSLRDPAGLFHHNVLRYSRIIMTAVPPSAVAETTR